jgi:predicted NAD/FAD-binding protein
MTQRERIAVIGSGAAGIVSAFLLQEVADVTIFEKDRRLGGHTSTVLVPQPDGSEIPIDTGFIVCNDRTYPNFHRFLERLQVPWRFADMSFSVVDELTGLQYGSKNIDTIFADRRNLFSGTYWKFLAGIQKFWNQANKDVHNEAVHHLPLREYLRRLGTSDDVIQHFILPISAAIWSTPDKLMLDFPVGIFLKFYANHGLLSVFNQPRWQTVCGGSYQYLLAFQRQFQGSILLNAPVQSVTRRARQVEVATQDAVLSFDRVIIATHADQVLPILQDPTEAERELFSTWQYLKNHTVLHTDASLLPPNKRAWASWNYRRELHDDGTRPLSITYHMNCLQGLDLTTQYLVTLNSRKEIAKEHIVKEFDYTHPHFTVASMATQPRIKALSGSDRIHYAGSYLRFGFHEDAVMSAVAVAEQFGVKL